MLKISILPLSLMLVFFELTLFFLNVIPTLLYPIGIIFINFYIALKYREYFYFSLVFFLMLWVNYSVLALHLGLIQDSYDGLYSSLNNTDISLTGLRVLFYFMLTTLVFSEAIKVRKSSVDWWPKFNSSTDIISALFIFLFAMISADYLLKFDVISKSIYEYSIIFLIFSIVMTRNRNQILQKVIIIIGLAAVIGNVLSGDRIVGLQFAIVLYLTYFKAKLSTKYIIPVGLAGVVFLSYTGANRAGFSVTDIAGIIDSSSVLFDRMMTLDTSFSAFFTSLRSIEFMQELDFRDRFVFFSHFVGSLVAGGLYPYEESNLATYTHSLGFTHSFGTFLPLLSYFYFGYVGVVVTAYLLVRFIKRRIAVNHLGSEVVVVYFCATFFRWYLYSPVMLLRGLFFIFIIYLIMKAFAGSKTGYVHAEIR